MDLLPALPEIRQNPLHQSIVAASAPESRQRLIARLYHVTGLSFEAIGELLDCSSLEVVNAYRKLRSLQRLESDATMVAEAFLDCYAYDFLPELSRWHFVARQILISMREPFDVDQLAEEFGVKSADIHRFLYAVADLELSPVKYEELVDRATETSAGKFFSSVTGDIAGTLGVAPDALKVANLHILQLLRSDKLRSRLLDPRISKYPRTLAKRIKGKFVGLVIASEDYLLQGVATHATVSDDFRRERSDRYRRNMLWQKPEDGKAYQLRKLQQCKASLIGAITADDPSLRQRLLQYITEPADFAVFGEAKAAVRRLETNAEHKAVFLEGRFDVSPVLEMLGELGQYEFDQFDLAIARLEILELLKLLEQLRKKYRRAKGQLYRRRQSEITAYISWLPDSPVTDPFDEPVPESQRALADALNDDRLLTFVLGQLHPTNPDVAGGHHHRIRNLRGEIFEEVGSVEAAERNQRALKELMTVFRTSRGGGSSLYQRFWDALVWGLTAEYNLVGQLLEDAADEISETEDDGIESEAHEREANKLADAPMAIDSGEAEEEVRRREREYQRDYDRREAERFRDSREAYERSRVDQAQQQKNDHMSRCTG